MDKTELKHMFTESQTMVRGSRIEGQGLFAIHPISSGQRIEYFQGYEINRPTRHSVTFNETRIEPTGSLRFLNHACAPNASFVDRWLVALRGIAVGEEITIDYLVTESDVSHGFMCKCSLLNCRGWIGRCQE